MEVRIIIFILFRVKGMFLSLSEHSKTSLLKEFGNHEQGLIKTDEVPWRTLLSEITLINEQKRVILEHLPHE